MLHSRVELKFSLVELMECDCPWATVALEVAIWTTKPRPISYNARDLETFSHSWSS